MIDASDQDKENLSLVFSGDREIPTRGFIVPVGNEASPSFPLKRWILGLGFPGSTVHKMIDSISHISNKNILLYIWRDPLVYLWQRTVNSVHIYSTSH